LSVDHLLKISEQGVKDLKRGPTVAVLLPATSLYLKENFAPGRKLWDAGVCVAIATDCNPGSSMCLSLPLVMTLSALYYGMSMAEILCSITYSSCKAMGIENDFGTIEVGKQALVTIGNGKRFEEAYYSLGWIPTYSETPFSL
jgi:imidazolonepropionase